jgi:uncharacterized damage-inducible protein DinB
MRGGNFMKETAEQYVRRLVGNLDGKDPLKIQKGTAKRLHKIIKSLGKKELKRKPAADKWSIAEILAHLADAELVAGWRLRLILTNDGAPIQAYDQNSWAKTFAYADRDPHESLRAFKFQRDLNLALLRSVPRKLWGNHGMHSERGKETVTHLVTLFAGHDVNHVRQVEQIAMGKKTKK